MTSNLVLLLIGGAYITPGILVCLSERFRAKMFQIKYMGVVGIAYVVGAILLLVGIS